MTAKKSRKRLFIKGCICSESNGDFSEFKLTAVDLHYRDPSHCTELLAIQDSLEKEKLKAELQSCLRFSMQIDGSLDTKQHDKKYIFVRFNKPEPHSKYKLDLLLHEKVKNVGLKACFVLHNHQWKKLVLQKHEDQSKFVGVSSDGESANTGHNSGLWSRMEEYVRHPTLNIWCACHRSHLAMEDLMQSVPELKLWHTNPISVATCILSIRTKELRVIRSQCQILSCTS